MREVDFWKRMDTHLGHAYARVWADQHQIAALGDRTVNEAVRDGIRWKEIWRAVWAVLELPDSQR